MIIIKNDKAKQTIVFVESDSFRKNQVRTEKLAIPIQNDKILIGHISLLKYNDEYLEAIINR